MTDDFLQQLHRSILAHDMIKSGETVLVAVSGGPDSLALLHGLHALSSLLNYHLHVVHLNHALREEADADAEFVQVQARRLGLPCTVTRARDLKTEADGRQARYAFYETVCSQVGATKVALGHHQDDTVETVLMHLIRGSGTAGLAGIAPVRDETFIRPLIDFTRQQIETFLADNGLTPRHDSTNADTYYLRNRIRHELIPQLESDYNPNIRAGLSRTATLLQAESEYLDEVALRMLERCRHTDLSGTRKLNRLEFLQAPIAVQRRMLRQVYFEMVGTAEDLYFTHCEAMLACAHGISPEVSIALPRGMCFSRSYYSLSLHPHTDVQNEPEDFVYPLTAPGETSLGVLNAEVRAKVEPLESYEGFVAPDGKREAVLDYDRLCGAFSETPGFIVRNRRQGDRFQPHGMQGTKKIKDLFIDAKVPRKTRDRVPILVCDDTILWVIGHTTSDVFKVGRKTRRCLYLSYVTHGTSS